MEHHFNVQVAQQLGVEEAIIVHHLFHWISKNAANDENMFDGLYWTYNSIKAYSVLFPYLSETKVKRVFKNLEDKGVIVKGNFSDDKWVRTNWYSFPLDTLNYLQSVGYDVHWVKMTSSIGSKCTNGEYQNDPMIIINNTNSKPNNKPKEKDSKEKENEQDFIDKIYKMYPAKCPIRNTSLGKCSKDKVRIKSLLKLYTKDEIEKVVRHEVDEKYDKSPMKNFSTFLNNFPDPESLFSENKGGSLAYPKNIDDVKDDDVMYTYDFYVFWLDRKCRNIVDNISSGFPENNEQYNRLVEHTKGGARGLAYACLVLNRDGWDKYQDENGFMWIYHKFIVANGMFIGDEGK